MFGDIVARDKAFLVEVELRHGPRGQAGVDQVGVHLTVGVHGGDGSVVSSEGGVTLLVEEANVSILKMAAGGAKEAQVIREELKDLVEREAEGVRGCAQDRVSAMGQGFPEGAGDAI